MSCGGCSTENLSCECGAKNLAQKIDQRCNKTPPGFCLMGHSFICIIRKALHQYQPWLSFPAHTLRTFPRNGCALLWHLFPASRASPAGKPDNTWSSSSLVTAVVCLVFSPLRCCKLAILFSPSCVVRHGWFVAASALNMTQLPCQLADLKLLPRQSVVHTHAWKTKVLHSQSYIWPAIRPICFDFAWSSASEENWNEWRTTRPMYQSPRRDDTGFWCLIFSTQGFHKCLFSLRHHVRKTISDSNLNLGVSLDSVIGIPGFKLQAIRETGQFQ